MLDAPGDLGGTVEVRAEGVALALQPDQRAAADRADRRELPLAQALLAQPEHGADDLGDHVARLAHGDGVPRPDVLGRHLVLVVEGRQADGRAPDEDGLEQGERRRLPGPPDGHHDVLEQGGAFLGRELEGDGPAGRLGRRAQLVAQGQVVHLHHDAVDLVVEVVAVLQPAHAVLVDLLQPGQALDLRVDGQAEGPDVVQGLVMGGEGRPAPDLAELVGPQRQVASGRDRRVLLAQRARRGVAGVHVAGQALALLFLVERVPRRDGHVDLAPDLQHVGGVARELLGDLGQGGHVGGDVLAHPTVAPGGGLDVAALLVADGHRQAVDLQLADVVHRRIRGLAQPTLEAGAPGHELLQLEGIVQRHHPNGVLDRGEGGGRRAADILRRRVGRGQVRELGLQGLQLTNEGVEVGVADQRVVERVVALVVEPNLLSQLLGPLGGGDLVGGGVGRHDQNLPATSDGNGRRFRRRPGGARRWPGPAPADPARWPGEGGGRLGARHGRPGRRRG